MSIIISLFTDPWLLLLFTFTLFIGLYCCLITSLQISAAGLLMHESSAPFCISLFSLLIS